ncbi:hypothetical protein PG987_006619 [Apiospora arundinis]
MSSQTQKHDRGIWREASELCQVDLDNIEDVYPLTPLQEALMVHVNVLTYKNCGTVDLAGWIEGKRLAEVMKRLVAQSPILRTRIVDCAAGLTQVVLKEEKQHDDLHRVIEQSTIELETLLAQEKARPMGLGTPLFRTVVWGQKLVMAIHHSISDQRTVEALLGDIVRLYKGEEVEARQDYRLFVEYCRSIDEESAKAFWASRFTEGASTFPRVKPGYVADATKTTRRVIQLPDSTDASLNSAVFVEMAWAMTSALYTQTDKVNFGFVFSGRTRHLGAVQSVLGPTVSSIPVQVHVTPDSTIRDQFKARLRQRQEVLNNPALHWGLPKIGTVSKEAAAASRFTTLVNILSPQESLPVDGGIGESHEFDRHGQYALSLNFIPGSKDVTVDALFDSEAIHEQQMDRVLRQFEHYLCALILGRPGDRLDSIPPISKFDHAEMLDWNQELPVAPHWCLHELFSQRAKRQPGHDAVEAADGILTYEMLNTLSDQVARDLQRRGLIREESVALVFEKSTWAVVAMLSVLKAGGVCVPIDHSYPPAQQEAVLQHSKAKVLLTSPVHGPSMQKLLSAVIVLDAQYVSQLPGMDDYGLDDGGSPDQAAFILFTSGSTGKPKGVVIEHCNLATVFKAFGQRVGWRPGTRILQFASFVWGASVLETIGTLLAGGVVCMPSAEARDGDLESFINDARVDFAILTPTCADPENTCVGGEAIDPESIRIWSDSSRFFNAWGQSETGVVATVGRVVLGSPFASSVGKPVGCAIWIAAQHDVSKMAPIGVPGEIVIEGPSVARGYLEDEERTAAAFISLPRWAPRRGRAACAASRMYRTGDLGMFYPDGSICYVGRRDNQVKIHGQKLDLGEVENALNMCEGVCSSIVTTHSTKDGSKLLVAVVSLLDSRLPTTEETLTEYTGPEAAVVHEHIIEIRRQISCKLPRYMIPTILLVVKRLPRTVSSKIDRRSIKQWLDEQNLSKARITTNISVANNKSLAPPETEIEKFGRKLSRYPKATLAAIVVLYGWGGDSMLGMQIAGHCRKLGVQVTVASLLRSATLAETAERSSMIHCTTGESPQVQDSDAVEFPVESIRGFLSDAGLKPTDVETILPCSPLQEGILMAQLRSPGQAYWDKITLELTSQGASTSVDIAKLSASWKDVCQAQPILRTVFTDSASSSVSRFQQVILKKSEPRLKLVTNESETRNGHANAADANNLVPQHCLYLHSAPNKAIRLSFHFNHALLDARSLFILFHQLGRAYTDPTQIRRGPNLSTYIQWTRRAIGVAQPYWNSFLSGARPCILPTLSMAEQKMLKAGHPKQISQTVPLEHTQHIHELCHSSGVTVANLFQVAWSIVMHHILQEPSVSFGSVLSQAESVELADVTLGPLITMIVCRVDALSGTPLRELLTRAKEDTNRATENPICDLEAVHDALDLGQSPLFNTAMTIVRQRQEELATDGDLKITPLPIQENPTEYPINVGVMFNNDEIQSVLWCDGDKVSLSFAYRIADMLARVVAKMVTDPNQTVADVAGSLEEPPASLSAGDMAPDIYRKAATQCECSPSTLEEIYPCTGLQQQQMERSVHGKIPSGGMDQFVYTFTQKESLERLRAAVEDTVKEVPALRTRLVSLRGYGACQTTTRLAPYWVEADSLDDHLLFDQSLPVRYGGPLARFGLVEEEDGNRYLVISLHRTIYDDKTLAAVVKAIETLYQGESPPKVQSFRMFTQMLPQTNPMVQATRWKSILSRCTKAWPLPTKAESLPDSTGPTTRTLQFDTPAVTRGSLETHFLHAAWAMCLTKWTGGRQICYGVSGAGLFRSAISHRPISGPAGVFLPLTMDVTDEMSAEYFEMRLRAEQNNLTSVMHSAMPEDCETSQRPGTENLFDNVLVCRSEPEEEPEPVNGKLLHHLPAMGACNQSSRAARLVAICTLGVDSVRLELQTDDTLGGKEDVDLMLHQLKHAITQVCLHPSTPFSKLEELSEYEIAMISQWHQKPLTSVTTPVHICISQAARTQWPNATALWSWDGELDYSQLDDLSDRVSTFLQSQGVGPGVMVAYFLEKSVAAVVVILGILKAGGCLVPMEICNPRDRLLAIIKETRPRCIICSPCYMGQLEYVEDIDKHQVDLASLLQLPVGTYPPAEAGGEDPCYIMYTSSSTGASKGIVVTHANLATGVSYQNEAIGLTSTSRCLQFCNFAFDASFIDAFSTFVSGACLCLPSEAERINDIHGVIRRGRCDYMYTTPAMGRALEPSEVPSLRVLALGGEVMRKEMVEKWRNIRLRNYYGPSELCMLASACDISSGSGRSHLSLGAGLSCRFWVVDPECHDRLLSPGSQGELVLQGPAVVRGYLNRPEQTKAAFIEPPAWVDRFQSLDMSHRWYKTGDMVIQRADGTVIFMGRKDGQVKLRGHRIELGEIEYHLQKSTKPGWSTVVELIRPVVQDQEPTLCVFYTAPEVDAARAPGLTETGDRKGLLPPLPDEVSRLNLALGKIVPPYMRPDLYVRLKSLPITNTNKLDKKALQHLGANLSLAELSARRATLAPEHIDTPHATDKTPETAIESVTETEKKLMTVWSEVLGIDVDTIGVVDDFFSNGGNSIRAMRLVQGARKLGLRLTVAGIFKSPTLSAMASLAAGAISAGQEASAMEQCTSTSKIVSRESTPFLANVAVESVLPATELQAYTVAVGEIDGRGFHNEMVIECKEGLDAQRLAKACHHLISHHSLFRTVFVQHKAALYQVAVKSPPVKQVMLDGNDTKTEEYIACWKHLPRFHLLSMSQGGERCHKLLLSIHHALYDAITIGILLQDLSIAYQDPTSLLEGPSYSDWLSHTCNLDPSPSLDFWRDHLRDSSMTRLAPQPSRVPGDHPLVDKKVFQVPTGSVPAASLSSAVHAAWAMVLSRLTGSRDVVFATTTANRNLPFRGIDGVAGCCLNLIPVRVRLNARSVVASLGSVAEQVQNDAAAAVPHHHVGYRSIMRRCTDWPARTRFGSILTYQIHESVDDDVVIGDTACSFGGVGRAGDSADAWVIVTPSSSSAGTSLSVELMYSKHVISDRKAEWISRCYTSIFESMDSGVIPGILYEGDHKEALEKDSGDVAGTPNGSPTLVGSEMLPLVVKAWREVGLEVSDLHSSLFNQADLVTAMLISCYYDKLGYCVTLKEILQHSTIAAQTYLLTLRA